jgi:hypothetical protein
MSDQRRTSRYTQRSTMKAGIGCRYRMSLWFLRSSPLYWMLVRDRWMLDQRIRGMIEEAERVSRCCCVFDHALGAKVDREDRVLRSVARLGAKVDREDRVLRSVARLGDRLQCHDGCRSELSRRTRLHGWIDLGWSAHLLVLIVLLRSSLLPRGWSL